MININGFMCEKCQCIYKDEETATKCENDHVDFRQLKVVDATYHKTLDQYSPYNSTPLSKAEDKLQSNTFLPYRIKVRYKEKEKTGYFGKSFNAYYELKNYEYKEGNRTND